MQIPSLFFIPLLLQSAPLPSRTPAPTPTVRLRSAQAAASIPIEVAGEGLAFVKGQVRGTDLWLLLDTASPSVLSEKEANKLGFAGEDRPPGGAGESRYTVRTLSDVTVRLPGVEIQQPKVSSFDLDLLQTALGHKIDGILGAPFFESFVVTIDFARARLSLADPKTGRRAGRGKTIAFTRDQGFPYVRAKVSLPGRPSLEGDFLLDTGADSAVILYSPFVDTHELLGPGAKVLAEPGGAAGAANLEAILRADKVEVGPFLFRQPVLQLSRSTRGMLADSKHAGLIGGAILSRFRVTLDYSRGRVILASNARYAEPFGYDASGLTLRAQGPDLSAFEIRRISPGSPGAAAGLVVGDVLLAVDGKPAKEIGLRGIQKMLQEAGKEYVLTIFREGQIRRMTVKCRKLL